MMAWTALALIVVYAVAAFGLRTILQIRRTGDSGFRGVSGRPLSAEWFAGVLFVAALATFPLGPIATLAGLPVIAVLDHAALKTAGVSLASVGLVSTLVAQLGMGSSWRVGVDADEQTDLITGGAFAYVRNPIFTAMVAHTVGLAMMVPSPVSIAGVLLLVLAVELQVRIVEEPYLRRTHAGAYTAYASQVGRFVPALGRLRA